MLKRKHIHADEVFNVDHKLTKRLGIMMKKAFGVKEDGEPNLSLITFCVQGKDENGKTALKSMTFSYTHLQQMFVSDDRNLIFQLAHDCPVASGTYNAESLNKARTEKLGAEEDEKGNVEANRTVRRRSVRQQKKLAKKSKKRSTSQQKRGASDTEFRTGSKKV